MRLAIATLLLAVLALMGSGCGEDVDLAAGLRSEQQYARTANGICAEVAQRFDEIQTSEPRTFEQAAEIVAALLGVARDGERELTSVEPPRSRAGPYRDYLDSRADVIAELEDAADAAAAEDGAGYARARETAAAAADKRARLARRAGLRGCARAEAG